MFFEDYNAQYLEGFGWDTTRLVGIGTKLLKSNLAIGMVNFSTLHILCFAKLKLKDNVI